MYIGGFQKSRRSAAGKDVLRAFQPQIKTRGIVVNIHEDLPVIYCERRRLARVLDNLLTKAIKYIERENPSPRIDVGIEEQNSQKIFFVRDNGIGIEKRGFDKIFQGQKCQVWKDLGYRTIKGCNH